MRARSFSSAICKVCIHRLPAVNSNTLSKKKSALTIRISPFHDLHKHLRKYILLRKTIEFHQQLLLPNARAYDCTQMRRGLPICSTQYTIKHYITPIAQ